MSSSVGLAVVGAGYWGPNLIRNAQATPGLRVEFLCDLDEERARAVLGEYSTVRVTPSFEDVLNDPAVQAVAIATPAATHFELVRAALESGKHVLVEKPITAARSDALKLVELAERSGLTLMCDHTFCYMPVVRRIRDMIHEGELGDIQFIDSVRINLGLVQPDVDVLWDLAPHDLSILDFILPPGVHPISVSAHGADPIGTGRACVAYLTLRLNTGAIAHVHVNWLSPTKVRTAIIGGSRRTLVWDDMNPAARLHIHDKGIDFAQDAALGREARHAKLVSYRTGDVVSPALPQTEALRGVMEEFAAAIAESRPAMTDGRAGLRVLEMLEAASRSLETGGVAVPVGPGVPAARTVSGRPGRED